jgi:chemotaxis protein CheX
MATEVQAEVLPGDLAQVVESVFATMLNLDVIRCDTPWAAGADRLTSAVHLAGVWNGAVLLECDRRQACCFAGRFLSMETPGKVDDDVRDVLGELANMIGGNLKCILPPGIQLSMPSVVDGSDYSLRVCGAGVRERLAFQSPEGLYWVTVLTTRP